MTCRVFTDPSGREWSVWEVDPHLFDARPGLHRSLVAEELAEGWLAFEAAGNESEKRRLAPVPPDWERMAEAVLLELWQRAAPVAPRHGVRHLP